MTMKNEIHAKLNCRIINHARPCFRDPFSELGESSKLVASGRRSDSETSVATASPMFKPPINANVSVLFVKKVFSSLNRSCVAHPATSNPNGTGVTASAT